MHGGDNHEMGKASETIVLVLGRFAFVFSP